MKYGLIAASRPGDNNVGEILIRDMMAVTPEVSYDLFSLVPSRGAGVVVGNLLGEVCQDSPQCDFPSEATIWGKMQRNLSPWLSYDRGIRQLSRSLVAWLKGVKPDRLWCIVNSVQVLDALAIVRPHVSVPLVLQIWDDPAYLLQKNGLGRLVRDRGIRRFRRLLGSADRVGVICESMACAYAKHVCGQPVVVRHGLDRVPAVAPRESGTFRIGMCGGLYAVNAWRALQSALDELDWSIGGRAVSLVFVGSHVQFDARKPARAEFHGWRTVSETARIMSGCDLLYLPQSFSANDRALTELSFPTKLSTYAATGRAVLIHSPFYGSLNKFSRTHSFGLLCDTLNAKELAQYLDNVGRDVDRIAELGLESERLAETILSRNEFRNATRHLLLGTGSA